MGRSHCPHRAQHKGYLVTQEGALRRALPVDLPLYQLAHVLLEQGDLELAKVDLWM